MKYFVSVMCLLVATAVQAQKQSFYIVRAPTSANATARYHHRGSTTTVNDQSIIFTAERTFSDMYVHCDRVPAADQVTLTLYNASTGATALTCAVTAAGATGDCSDTNVLDAATVTAGQRVAMRSVGTANIGSPAPVCLIVTHMVGPSGAETDDTITWSSPGSGAAAIVAGRWGGAADIVTETTALSLNATSATIAAFAFAHDTTILNFTGAMSPPATGSSLVVELCKLTGNLSCSDSTNGATGLQLTFNSSSGTPSIADTTGATNRTAVKGEWYAVKVVSAVGMDTSACTSSGVPTACCTGPGTGSCNRIAPSFSVQGNGGGQTITSTRHMSTGNNTTYLSTHSSNTEADVALLVPETATARDFIQLASASPWTTGECFGGSNDGTACSANPGPCTGGGTCGPVSRVCQGTTSAPSCTDDVEFRFPLASTTGAAAGTTLTVAAGHYVVTKIPPLNGTTSQYLSSAFQLLGPAASPTPTPAATSTPIPTATPSPRWGCCQPTPQAGAAGNSFCPTPGTENCGTGPTGGLFMPFTVCGPTYAGGPPCPCQQ